MREPRQSFVKWEKHVLTVKKSEFCTIYDFAEPNTNMYRVIFINASGILAVTGDLGNWIFCREFHPGPKGYVSDGYWIEKLQISSRQEGREFNEEGTKAYIQEMLDERFDELSDNDNEDPDGEYENPEEDEGIIYLRECLDRVEEGEHYYLAWAHENMPDGYDHESVPHVKKTDGQLEYVFDAFDEICKRMSL